MTNANKKEYKQDEFAIDMLETFGLTTNHCKRATLYVNAGEPPEIEVVYSLAHVPVFDKLGEIHKNYTVVNNTLKSD